MLFRVRPIVGSLHVCEGVDAGVAGRRGIAHAAPSGLGRAPLAPLSAEQQVADHLRVQGGREQRPPPLDAPRRPAQLARPVQRLHQLRRVGLAVGTGPVGVVPQGVAPQVAWFPQGRGEQGEERKEE